MTHTHKQTHGAAASLIACLERVSAGLGSKPFPRHLSLRLYININMNLQCAVCVPTKRNGGRESDL